MANFDQIDKHIRIVAYMQYLKEETEKRWRKYEFEFMMEGFKGKVEDYLASKSIK